jgi:hypothetical protein
LVVVIKRVEQRRRRRQLDIVVGPERVRGPLKFSSHRIGVESETRQTRELIVDAITGNRSKVRRLDFLNEDREVERVVGRGPVDEMSSALDGATPVV